MCENERNRDECCIRNKEEGKNRISENIFQTWSPTLGKHLLENGYESSSNNWAQLRSRTIQHIEGNWILLIGWVKENNIIGS